MIKNLYRLMKFMLALSMALVCVSCGKDKNTISPSDTRTSRNIIEELAVYYGTYGNEADKNIESLLQELDKSDPVAGEKWRSIEIYLKRSFVL